MWIFWLGVLALIGVGLYHLIKRSKPRVDESSEEAMEILRRRYARGEISQAEFERMKETLHSWGNRTGAAAGDAGRQKEVR